MRVAVTGGASGIGLAVCEKFWAEGWDVLSIDIQGSLQPWPHQMLDVCTLTAEDFVDNPVHVVVNCARAQDDIDTNLTGLINVCEHLGINNPYAMAVVNITSVNAYTGRYVASRGGVLAYTKWLAEELAPRGVLVNSISLGGAITPMTKDSKKFQWSLDSNEIAYLAWYLVAKNMVTTGQNIVIGNRRDV